MPYIVHDAEHRKLGQSIGSGECVALVQHWSAAPNTGLWHQGVKVKGNDGLIQKGTVIATFVDGKYPNHAHGNHAAIYLGQDGTGIHVIDQWHGQAAHKRTIHFGGGNPQHMSNDGDYFYVVE
jgi:hypothetical protein